MHRPQQTTSRDVVPGNAVFNDYEGSDHSAQPSTAWPDDQFAESVNLPKRRDPLTRTLIVTIGILVGLVSFLVGMIAERELLSGIGAADTPVNGNRIEAMASLIESEFYYQSDDGSDLEAQRLDMENGAIAGMTASLDDPYTAFLPPQEAAPVNDQLEGEYEGIGVTIQVTNDELVVIRPEPGGPAERAGLLAGDVIETAAGVPLRGEELDRAGELIRGPAGTTVDLTIRRDGLDSTFHVSVARERLEERVVIYQFDDVTSIATIRVGIFNDKTTAQFDAALMRVQEDGATGIVLDLRGNNGGWVTASQEMLGRFLDPAIGPAMYEDIGRVAEDGDLLPLPILAGSSSPVDLPLLVLIDGGTASAAEIVAGALQDYDRATLIGQPSFGKGSVQRVHNFEDGSSLRVTVAEWLTPDEHRLSGTSLVPDVAVTNEGAEPGTDVQLQEAMRYLVTGGWSSIIVEW